MYSFVQVLASGLMFAALAVNYGGYDISTHRGLWLGLRRRRASAFFGFTGNALAVLAGAWWMLPFLTYYWWQSALGIRFTGVYNRLGREHGWTHRRSGIV